ncbi:Predicted protein [Mesomycoplasma hyopneumoniae 168]|uniref:Uncharacterized protein n=2 Tax=Mesomycoplasma hyopneumoniae (strain 168) TaxID=907287 RepID=E4QTW3_MESH1|nr:Predicted protein [Mesomycoplasma hyopneumoniae 168]AGM22432.1 hypothetical protein MHP168L_667 [Mesomycoplasma hyopneumoniae 168-L]
MFISSIFLLTSAFKSIPFSARKFALSFGSSNFFASSDFGFIILAHFLNSLKIAKKGSLAPTDIVKRFAFLTFSTKPG